MLLKCEIEWRREDRRVMSKWLLPLSVLCLKTCPLLLVYSSLASTRLSMQKVVSEWVVYRGNGGDGVSGNDRSEVQWCQVMEAKWWQSRPAQSTVLCGDRWMVMVDEDGWMDGQWRRWRWWRANDESRDKEHRIAQYHILFQSILSSSSPVLDHHPLSIWMDHRRWPSSLRFSSLFSLLFSLHHRHHTRQPPDMQLVSYHSSCYAACLIPVHHIPHLRSLGWKERATLLLSSTPCSTGTARSCMHIDWPDTNIHPTLIKLSLTPFSPLHTYPAFKPFWKATTMLFRLAQGKLHLHTLDAYARIATPPNLCSKRTRTLQQEDGPRKRNLHVTKAYVLFWVQCLHCKNMKQSLSSPYLDPINSSFTPANFILENLGSWKNYHLLKGHCSTGFPNHSPPNPVV